MGLKNYQPYDFETKEPAQGECECGTTVVLDNRDPNWAYLGNNCLSCGRLYNLSGQELRPMEEWEEPIDDDY